MYFYDGSWECFQGFHLAFFIVSISVILVFVVVPVIMLVITVHNGAGKICYCFDIPVQAIDVIAHGLRYSSNCFV